MTPWMRKIHKWIGLLIGLQLVLWMSSGFMMSFLDAEKVRGREFRAAPAAKKPWPADALPVSGIVAKSAAVQSISTGWLLDRPVYRLKEEKASRLVDARTGQRVELDAALAQRLAVASSGAECSESSDLRPWSSMLRRAQRCHPRPLPSTARVDRRPVDGRCL